MWLGKQNSFLHIPLDIESLFLVQTATMVEGKAAGKITCSFQREICQLWPSDPTHACVLPEDQCQLFQEQILKATKEKWVF